MAELFTSGLVLLTIVYGLHWYITNRVSDWYRILKSLKLCINKNFVYTWYSCATMDHILTSSGRSDEKVKDSWPILFSDLLLIINVLQIWKNFFNWEVQGIIRKKIVYFDFANFLCRYIIILYQIILQGIILATQPVYHSTSKWFNSYNWNHFMRLCYFCIFWSLFVF